MFLPKSLRIATTTAMFFAVCMPAYAGQFTSAEFLKWKADSRDFYVRTTASTAITIAAKNDDRHAKCLEQWYFSDEEKSNEEIYSAMRKNGNYHPRLVILAMMEKKCGTFKY